MKHPTELSTCMGWGRNLVSNRGHNGWMDRMHFKVSIYTNMYRYEICLTAQNIVGAAVIIFSLSVKTNSPFSSWYTFRWILPAAATLTYFVSDVKDDTGWQCLYTMGSGFLSRIDCNLSNRFSRQHNDWRQQRWGSLLTYALIELLWCHTSTFLNTSYLLWFYEDKATIRIKPPVRR